MTEKQEVSFEGFEPEKVEDSKFNFVPETTDISFEEEEVIEAPESIADVESQDDIQQEEIIEEEKEEKEVSKEVSFEDGKEVEEVAKSNLTAIQSVMKNRLDRYNLELEKDIFEYTEEELIELEEKLDDWKVNQIVEDRWSTLKQSNSNIEKVLEFIENGGSPEKITSLFSQQKEVSSIDTTSEDGKVKLMKSYYTDVMGWDEDKIDKKIDRLLNSGLLEEEISDIKPEYDKHFEKKQEEIIREQESKKIQEETLKKRKIVAFDEVLNQQQLGDSLKESIRNVAFRKVKTDEGIVDYFDYRIKEFKDNPELFFKLSTFLTNPLKYDEMVTQGSKNTTVTSQMKKGFQMPKKQAPIEQTQQKQTKEKITFKF